MIALCAVLHEVAPIGILKGLEQRLRKRRLDYALAQGNRNK